MQRGDFIIEHDDLILITGATGFIGPRLLQSLLDRGFRNIRCLARFSSNVARLETIAGRHGKGARIAVVKGNLLSREDCAAATKDVALIFHLAAGGSDKSFPDAFLNSVVTTRNLLEAALQHKCLKRFVNIGSLAVYANTRNPRRRLLDEACPVEFIPSFGATPIVSQRSGRTNSWRNMAEDLSFHTSLSGQVLSTVLIKRASLPGWGSALLARFCIWVVRTPYRSHTLITARMPSYSLG